MAPGSLSFRSGIARFAQLRGKSTGSRRDFTTSPVTPRDNNEPGIIGRGISVVLGGGTGYVLFQYWFYQTEYGKKHLELDRLSQESIKRSNEFMAEWNSYKSKKR